MSSLDRFSKKRRVSIRENFNQHKLTYTQDEYDRSSITDISPLTRIEKYEEIKKLKRKKMRLYRAGCIILRFLEFAKLKNECLEIARCFGLYGVRSKLFVSSLIKDSMTQNRKPKWGWDLKNENFLEMFSTNNVL